jgi:hypothetical protein
MGFFSYKFGGRHHTQITNDAFSEALEMVRNDQELLEHYKELAEAKELSEFETFDFPVSEILGVFYEDYRIQEERDGIPQELQLFMTELGSKDMIQYGKFIDQYNAKIDKRNYNWKQKSFKEMVASSALSAVVSGVVGKSKKIRIMEKDIINYISGNSQQLKDYIMKYVVELEADDMIHKVCMAIMHSFLMQEAVKYNRC